MPFYFYCGFILFNVVKIKAILGFFKKIFISFNEITVDFAFRESLIVSMLYDIHFSTLTFLTILT